MNQGRRIDPSTFRIGAALATALFAAAIYGSERALPWLAEILAPRGINAGLALNGIWLAAGLIYAVVMGWLTARRLRDAGRPAWWGWGCIVAVAAVVLASDSIFLVSRSFPALALLAGYLSIPVCIGAVGVLAIAALAASDPHRPG
jgi:uncharacterized membrane protein YhaH (DUF805 family)